MNVHEAKANLSRLLARAELGDDVVIARNGEPVALLAPLLPRKKRELGILGAADVPFDVFAPMEATELCDWGSET